MSIYRDARNPLRDLYATEAVKKTPVSQREPTQPSAEQEEYKHLRKAAPVDTLLPLTLRWIASLPPHLQPTALLRDYPRIANLLAAMWGDPKAFETYMDSLLTDKRGSRRGFPADVQRELVALALNHTQDNFGKRMR